MADWRTCDHVFRSYFGPVLTCRKCGAVTTLAAAPGESKPIYSPFADETEPHSTGTNEEKK